MAIRINGQKPGNLGPPFRKRQIRYNSSHEFRQDAPFDVRTGKDVPLVSDPKDQVALLEVLEEHNDYLVCQGLNPYTEEWMDRVLVAKPYLLQITPFDGKTIELANSTVTYDYDDSDKNTRTATTVDNNDEETSETQTLRVPYFIQDEEETYAKDIICAIRTTVVTEDESQTIDDTGLIERNDAGQPVDEDGNVIDEDKAKRIEWLDLNTGARRWVGPPPVGDLIALDLERSGGKEGDAENPCTFVYHVFPFESNEMLLANQSPVFGRHRYRRPNLGVRQEATVYNALEDLDANGFFDIILTEDNEVDNFAAGNAFEDGVVAFRSINNLTIFSILETDFCDFTFIETDGVSAEGDILIETGRDIALKIMGPEEEPVVGAEVLVGREKKQRAAHDTRHQRQQQSGEN